MGQVYDFAIVGAGIVGLSIAAELRGRFPESRIVVLEKEAAAGTHASGRNSGVLHSGIYYPKGSLKAKVCADGAARMQVFAREHDIPCSRTGKLIIATNQPDLDVIDKLLANARENNICADRLNEEEVQKMEPAARPFGAGIYCPDTAVIDSKAVVNKLHEILLQKGVKFLFNFPVAKVQKDRRHVIGRDNTISYGYLVNSAGAYADTIARKFGLASDYVLMPFKGYYYRLKPNRRHLVRGNIYPVPDPSLPFLGVHFTRVIGGEVYVGPTAIPALGRENYSLLEGISLGESAAMAARLARMYLVAGKAFRRLVHGEICKVLKPCFTESARRLVPAVASEDLIPSNKIGIRPQLVNTRDMRLEMDYIVEKTETSIHILNAISPAFTSAMAFAEFIVEQIEGKGSRWQ